jgi:Sec-independent protein translocase protein TatA
VIAFFPTLGWQEMFLLLVLGLLLYGRNLPDAGRSLGRVMAQLKRSFHDFKDQIDRDGEIRDVKKALQDTAREVKNVAKVPRAVSNPSDALRDLTHEAMSSPVDDEATTDDDATHPENENPDDSGLVDGESACYPSVDGDPVSDVDGDPVSGAEDDVDGNVEQRKDWSQP